MIVGEIIHANHGPHASAPRDLQSLPQDSYPVGSAKTSAGGVRARRFLL